MKSRANGLLILLALAVGLALAWVLAPALPLTLLDFLHYYQAGRLIWQGQNPYGVIEFFAPPWLALFLAPLLPLSLKFASAIWIILTLASIGAATVLSQKWSDAALSAWARRVSLIAMLLTPAALFVYITGQLSALVALAVLIAGGVFLGTRRTASAWVPAICLAFAAVKPNIIWLPAGLIGLEMVRRRDWRVTAASALVLALLGALSFIWLPAWPAALLAAWRAGAYRGGAGLVASGYVGLSELGAPIWLFAPLLVYALIVWWREGLSAHVLALAFALCLLVTPYSRSYDDVVLIFPSLACLAAARGLKRWLSLALIIAAWLAPLFAMAVLAPVLISLAVLLAFPALRLGVKTAPAPVLALPVSPPAPPPLDAETAKY